VTPSGIAATSNSRQRRSGSCPCCGRTVALTFHHLIPRKLHRRTRFRKRFDRDTLNRGIFICRRCHSGIHASYDEMTLASYFSTPNALLRDPTLRRHFAWVSRQREY
jgi:Na+-translocating ferredoxin:NAD+ oxidoreductase RnfC subunit